MKNKIVKILVCSICQYILLIVAIMIYNSFFKLKHPNIAIGLAYYYYIRMIFPIVILIFNSTFFITKKKIRIILYFIPTVIILLYWCTSIENYPFRISFIIVVSLLVLVFPLLAQYYKKKEK